MASRTMTNRTGRPTHNQADDLVAYNDRIIQYMDIAIDRLRYQTDLVNQAVQEILQARELRRKGVKFK